MHERQAAQVVVDEGDDHADLGQAQPHAHVLGAVAHEERHRVALLEALCEERVGHAVAVLVDLQGTEGQWLHTRRTWMHLSARSPMHRVPARHLASTYILVGPRLLVEAEQHPVGVAARALAEDDGHGVIVPPVLAGRPLDAQVPVHEPATHRERIRHSDTEQQYKYTKQSSFYASCVNLLIVPQRA